MKKFIKEFKEFAVKGNVLTGPLGVAVGGGVQQDRVISGIGYHHARNLPLTGKVSLKDLSFTLQTRSEPIVLSTEFPASRADFSSIACLSFRSV